MRFQNVDFGKRGMNGVLVGKGNFGNILFNSSNFGMVDQGSYKSNTVIADALQNQLRTMYPDSASKEEVSNALQDQYNSLMNKTVAPGTKVNFSSGIAPSFSLMNFIKTPMGIAAVLAVFGGIALLTLRKKA
jgi:hypothetical protein